MDRAGFVSLLAANVLSAPSEDGYVVGLTGDWGAGKSSVLNLLETQLGNETYIVRFNPWMFSTADVLVVRFFAALANAVKVQADTGGGVAQTARRRAAQVGPMAGNVASGLARLGASMAPVASLVLGPVGSVMGVPKAVIEDLQARDGVSPEGLREELCADLRQLDRKIVVFIDDLDRVGSNAEVRELIRLVKLVGDLPNVVYVLSYEPRRVEQALSEVGNDGRQYLEKIVQAPHALPPVRTSQLSAMAAKLIKEHFEDRLVSFEAELWREAVVSVFAYFRTVRDIKRFVNAALADASTSKDEVATQDVLSLAAIRVFDPTVYSALPRIAPDLTGVPSVADLGIDRKKRLTEATERINAVLETSAHPETTRALLRHLFPGSPISGTAFEGSERAWRRGKRVAVRSVLDTFLHASLADGTLASKRVRAIIDGLAAPGNVTAELDALTPAEVSDLLGRLGDHPEALPTTDAAPAILAVLKLRHRLSRQLGLGMPHDWKVGSAIEALLSGIDPAARTGQLEHVIRNAETLSDAFFVLRAHGRSEDDAHEPGDPGRLFTRTQTEQLEVDLRAKIRRRPSTLTNELDFNYVFWLAEEDPDTLSVVQAASRDDADLFLTILESCVSHILSSARPYDRYELKVDAVERRLGPIDLVADRATELTVHAQTPGLKAALEELKRLRS